jgi:hypothetical protein
MQESTLSTESLEDRVRRMTIQYEKWAGADPGEVV